MFSKIMMENNLLKIKIAQFEKEYIKKKDIKTLNEREIIKMRKAVTSRLQKEIKSLTQQHDTIINTLYHPKEDFKFLQHLYY